MASSLSGQERSSKSAASEAFLTTEILASILGHLDAEQFSNVHLAHPNALKVAKQYPKLRRQFFVEQEHGYITNGCSVNPLFTMVLRIFHWRFFKVVNDPTVFADPGFQFVIDRTIFGTPPTDAGWSLLEDLRPLLQEMLFAQATGPLEIWPRSGPLSVEPKSDYGRGQTSFGVLYVPENEKSVWDVLSIILEVELRSRVKYKIASQEDNVDYVLHNGRIGLASLADAVDLRVEASTARHCGSK
ncbi:hypothetical protein CBER1_04509 [Cercospora berteroae]|uniref:Uncharacterized protein n=1 Tax=Cercospora berteroae TaxID=357750 RepID=A0A2S6CF16_9PEZI|nr:hypothetical protein CBER1_04509 [Cercospora berteroae]